MNLNNFLRKTLGAAPGILYNGTAEGGFTDDKKRSNKAFFFKSVLPVTVALILYCIFKSACMKDGELDFVWLWILCGLPFGLHRMCLWIVPGGGSLGGGIALFALNFIIGGVIGGFVLAWRLIVAVWYVPLTVYRLIVG